jgi:toluene monooxygenase electron transfer component
MNWSMNLTPPRTTRTTFSNSCSNRLNTQKSMKIAVQSRSGEAAFDCGDSEAILHAGLRQGISLPYECATGTCGTCRARVLSGTVEVRWKEAPGGARLKPEKGDILMCQTRARSDCVLKVPSEIGIMEQHPAQRRGIIRDIRKLTHDVARFEIRLSAPMSFEAGQFVVVDASQIEGGRAYSMVNFDTEGDLIELVVKRKPGGRFSDWLFSAQQGHPEVVVFGPLGRAVFRPREKKNIVCIAGGSGIAGMMSMLQCAVQADYFRDHKGSVFFGVRTLQDAFYLEPLARYVTSSHGNLEVLIALSDEAATTAFHADFPVLRLAGGFVHEVARKAMAGGAGDTIAFVAGPPVMVDAAIRGLIICGMPSQDIRYDKFG